MRGVWIDNGTNPDYAKLARYGITVPFFDPRDPRVTADYLAEVAAHPGIDTCGIYTAWNWDGTFKDPKTYVQWTDAVLRNIGWPGNALVCLDMEKGANGVTDATFGQYVVAALKEWRRLRPKRDTWWTLEGFQGGNFSVIQVQAIAGKAVRIAPQMYAGNMAPLEHDVTIDLLVHSFPPGMLDGMYDAAVLPYAWRGFAFTQGRLP